MGRTSRTTKIFTAFAAVGVLAIGWLLGTSSSKSYYNGGADDYDPKIICAPVLFGPDDARSFPEDQEEYRDGDGGEIRVREADDDRTVPACQQLRAQMLGWSVLLAIPTTVLATLAALRHRDETSGHVISHDEAIRLAG